LLAEDAVTGEKRGYCNTGRITAGELVSGGGREKGDCAGAKTQPGEGFWFLLCLSNVNKLESNSKANNYYYFKDYLEDNNYFENKNRMIKTHCSL
jgi:hypothetical protein